MYSRKRLVSSVSAGALIIIAVVLVYSLQGILTIFNPTSGVWNSILVAEHPAHAELKLPGLKSTVMVQRDEWGVPHIFADSEDDLFYAFGFVQAQDRLAQMDFGRRLARGMLSEVVGRATYDTDLFFRVVGLERAAQATLDQMSASEKSMLQRFADGVNEYMAGMGPNLPVEFKLLGYVPQPWTPLDTASFAKLMAWSLSGDFGDIELARIVKAFGENTALKLFPLRLPKEIVILPDTVSNKSKRTGTIDDNFSSHLNLLSPKGLDALLEWRGRAHAWLPSYEASNDWVVDGAKTVSGKPMLANDPHLQLTAPPIWYEAHLVVAGVLDVRGVTFAGTPVIILGHNERVAWGFTNVGADVIDFYYYRFNDDRTSYWYVDHWESVRKQETIINVKLSNGFEERRVTLNFTRHGPLIERDGQAFGMRWTGSDPSPELLAVYGFNKARNIAEFREAVRNFQVPAQNIVYADVDGNIAYWTAGKYPIRKSGLGIAPVDGSVADFEWTGFVPFDEIPYVLNPRQHYVATANNKPVGDLYPHYLGSFWASRYRAERIVNLLESKPKLSLEDMKAIQTDTYSILASVFVPLVIRSYANSPAPDLAKVVDILKDWNFRMEVDQAAPTIFHEWYAAFEERAWSEQYRTVGLKGPYPFIEVLEQATLFPSSGLTTAWLTAGDRDREIISSLRDASSKLTGLYGSNPSDWKWGRHHKVSIEHPLGSALNWLNYPQSAASGGVGTINVSPGLTAKHGPSYRQIIDLSDLSRSLTVIPGGQNGNPFSAQYRSQLPLWLAGSYKPMGFPKSPSETTQVQSALVLKP